MLFDAHTVDIEISAGEDKLLRSVNSNTTGTITPMFSSYDWMKPNLKQKAGTARGKWLVRKDWGKLRGSEKFVFERKYA